jgi:hypothetical protein
MHCPCSLTVCYPHLPNSQGSVDVHLCTNDDAGDPATTAHSPGNRVHLEYSHLPGLTDMPKIHLK